MAPGYVNDLPISTTFDLPGYTVERTLGLCWGLIVRSATLCAFRADSVASDTQNSARKTEVGAKTP
jgi:hypothetical protein